jgi:hypothetical protein
MIKKGFVLGGLNIVEALAWLFIGKKYFGITGINQLHSFGFAILFFASIFNILILRTPNRFYKQPIGKLLLGAIIADIIVVVLILTLGVPSFGVLPILVTGGSLLYFMLCDFILNDWIKVKINGGIT